MMTPTSGGAGSSEGLSAGGAAALGLASSVVSAAGSGIFGSIHAKKAHKRNMEAWHMSNAYNHPREQMKRLKEAGLNPNLIYGGGSGTASGQAGSVPGSPKADPLKLDLDPMTSMLMSQDIKKRTAETENLKASKAVIMNDAMLKAARVGLTVAQTSHTKSLEKKVVSLLGEQMDLMKEQVRKAVAEADRSEVERDVAKDTKEHKVEYAKELVQDLIARKGVNITQKELLEMEKKLREETKLSWNDKGMWRILPLWLQELYRQIDNTKPIPKKIF